MQMEDELASMGAIVGASLSGMKSFTATSGPGFSLMQENLGMATMGEVPVVVVNVQRSGLHGSCHQTGAVRHNATALGSPWRSGNHRPYPGLGAGMF